MEAKELLNITSKGVFPTENNVEIIAGNKHVPSFLTANAIVKRFNVINEYLKTNGLKIHEMQQSDFDFINEIYENTY